MDALDRRVDNERVDWKGDRMLVSTLSEVPGVAYEVRGLVFADAKLGAIGGGNMQKMVKSLVGQAEQLGANAIIDVRTVLGGDAGYCVMTGTAVLLRQSS
ncbi:hypothetical protein [Dactylosporangium sp. CA-233914]|uniref:hypothetical protein n=1 Tax=Dactylosporangium sp. CA-233914 TaxID=3239934 RepID=UPI003D8C09B3